MSRDTLERAKEALLQKPIEDLEPSARLENCLENEGILTIGQLCQKAPHELLTIKHFGLKTLKEVRELLSFHGLSLVGDDRLRTQDQRILGQLAVGPQTVEGLCLILDLPASTVKSVLSQLLASKACEEVLRGVFTLPGEDWRVSAGSSEAQRAVG